MRRLALIAGLAGLLMAACGGAEPSATTGAGSESPVPDSEPAATAVQVAETEHGEVLVDGEGSALYLFTNDQQGPSTCGDSCAALWPALAAGSAGDGVDEGLIGSADGVQGPQVTYNGWPLYYYADDVAPGDVNGQGFNGVWFLVGADGNPVMEDATSENEGDTSSEGEDSSGIYSEPGY